MNSGSLSLLEPSSPVQACAGSVLPLPVFLSMSGVLKPEVPSFESFLLNILRKGRVHQVSYSMDFGILWSHEYRNRCTNLRGEELLQKYLHFPDMPSWFVQGQLYVFCLNSLSINLNHVVKILAMESGVLLSFPAVVSLIFITTHATATALWALCFQAILPKRNPHPLFFCGSIAQLTFVMPRY